MEGVIFVAKKDELQKIRAEMERLRKKEKALKDSITKREREERRNRLLKKGAAIEFLFGESTQEEFEYLLMEIRQILKQNDYLTKDLIDHKKEDTRLKTTSKKALEVFLTYDEDIDKRKKENKYDFSLKENGILNTSELLKENKKQQEIEKRKNEIEEKTEQMKKIREEKRKETLTQQEIFIPKNLRDEVRDDETR